MGCILTTFLLIVAPCNSQAQSVVPMENVGTSMSSSIFLAAKLSSSVFFQDFALEYYRKADNCKQIGYVPSKNRTIKITDALWTACQIKPEVGTWVPYKGAPGPEWRPYYMFTLMMTESGGKSHNTSKPKEKTYGFCCVSITEARGVCYVHHMACPKYDADIVEKLQNDLSWAATIALRAWESYAGECKGDIMAGLMCYKYGTAKYATLLDNYHGNIKACEQYGYFMRKLDTVRCAITQMGFYDGCLCFNGDNI